MFLLEHGYSVSVPVFSLLNNHIFLQRTFLPTFLFPITVHWAPQLFQVEQRGRITTSAPQVIVLLIHFTTMSNVAGLYLSRSYKLSMYLAWCGLTWLVLKPGDSYNIQRFKTGKFSKCLLGYLSKSPISDQCFKQRHRAEHRRNCLILFTLEEKR